MDLTIKSVTVQVTHTYTTDQYLNYCEAAGLPPTNGSFTAFIDEHINSDFPRGEITQTIEYTSPDEFDPNLDVHSY